MLYVWGQQYMLHASSCQYCMQGGVCVCVCERERERERDRERERISLGSPAWAFWNVSNIYVHSNLGFNFLPQPLCLRKEEPAYLTALFLLFKLSLPSCHGCRSWPWLLPADWKGWLLDLYMTSLILERLSEVVHCGWVSTSFITDIVSRMKVQGDLRSWHLLTRSSLQAWSLTCYLTRFVTEILSPAFLSSHWIAKPWVSGELYSELVSPIVLKCSWHPRGKVTTCLCTLNPMLQKEPGFVGACCPNNQEALWHHLEDKSRKHHFSEFEENWVLFWSHLEFFFFDLFSFFKPTPYFSLLKLKKN